MAVTPSSTPTTRLPRRSTRGVILGLSGPRCAALGTAVAIVVVALFSLGVSGLVGSAVLWVPLCALAYVRLRGRTVAEWLPVAVHYGARRLGSQTLYRAAVSRPRLGGTMALPGDGARLRFHVDADSGACMIHDPRMGTLVAVAQVAHPAYLLLSPTTQRARVNGWGGLIASLAATGSASVIQVLESTLPDPGAGVDGWWRTRGRQDGSWPAGQYEALLAGTRHGSTAHRTLVSLGLDMRTARRAIAGHGRGLKGAAAVLRGDMASLEYALRSAELRVERWLGDEQVAAVVRNAYHPAGDVPLDGFGGSPSTAGPVAVNEAWDHLRHDSAYSATLWVEQWPRTEQRCDFLHALIFAQRRDGAAVRKSLSLIIVPLPVDRAQAQIQKEMTEAVSDAEQKARIGQIPKAADRQAQLDIQARDEALAAGHADCEFSGFVTVTAPTRDRLATDVAVIEQAAHRAHCQLRVLYGVQGQAFIVGALPFARRVC
jgi:Putative type VII ESX secretion system translocon, EccE